MVQQRRPWLHVRRYRTIVGLHARFISIFIHFPILFLVSSESGHFFLQRMEVWRWKSLEQHPMYVHVFSCFLVSEWATVRRSLACTQYVLRYLTRFRVYRQADYRIGNLSRSVESITSLCPHWSWTFPGEGVCWSRWVNAFQNIGWTCIPSTARWSVYE